MKLLGAGVIKPANELSFGELFSFKGGQEPALGIYLGAADGRLTVGILDGGKGTGRTKIISGNMACYSYGLDWVLDVSQNPIPMPGTMSDQGAPRAFLRTDGLCISFIDGNYDDIRFFNLDTQKSFESWPTEVVLYEKFAIWRDEDSRISGKEKPLYSSSIALKD